MGGSAPFRCSQSIRRRILQNLHKSIHLEMALKTFHFVQGLSRTPLLFISRYLTNIISEHILQKEKLEHRKSAIRNSQNPGFTYDLPCKVAF